MKKKSLLSKVRSFYRTHRNPVLIGSAALVLIVILAVMTGFRNNSSQVDETTKTVALTRGDVTQSIEIVGSVRAVPSATLTWSTSGFVMPFTVKVGDRFEAGDVILELDPATVPANILQAQLELIEAKDNLALLQSADSEYQTAAQVLSDAKDDYDQAQAKFMALNEKGALIETIEALIEEYYAAREALWKAQDAVTATETLAATDQMRIEALIELDKTRRAYNLCIDTIMNVAGFYFGTEFGSSHQSIYLNYRGARAALNEARVDWNNVRNNSDAISAAEAKVQSLTNTVNSVYILAPFTGTVTDIFNFEGDHVTQGTDAIQLDNLDTMLVDVNVSEVDVNYINVGESVTVTFDALPGRTYNGLVTQVGGSGIDTDGIIKFNVSITLTDADEAIKPGFTAVSAIITDEARDAIMIPVSAIHTLDDRNVVVIMRNGSLAVLPVTLGATSDLYAALLEGDLQEGDQIVTALDQSTLSGLGVE